MKTAIVGAGINGLYLAWQLSKAGHEVTVFEKKEKIGKEACSGLFSERILEFIPESKRLVENEINSVLIHFPKKTLKICFSRKFFVMSHFQLDNLVAGLARNEGAKIILNQAVNSLPEGFERIIGCDGPLSTVRKKLNLAELDYRLAIQGFVSKEDKSDSVETWPIKSGFLWKIPRGKEVEYGIIAKPSLVKGVGDENKSSSSPFTVVRVFDEFLRKRNIQVERMKSALVPQNFCIPANAKITLCGDAAGLTKPWSGGGVIWGLVAAGILLKNFPDFLKYQKEARSFFLPRIISSKICTVGAYFFGFRFPWIIPTKIKIESDFLI